MRCRCFTIFVFIFTSATAQFEFSGNVDVQRWQRTVHLSLIEDYRKLSGIYPEQVIAKVEADSSGYFRFSGDFIEETPRLYRLHVDNCSGDVPSGQHFGGSCPDYKQVLFIAKNTDTIHMPISFDNQMFCDIESNDERALAFLKIDSLKDEMRFAYTEIRSDANRKLNNRKWFKTLQDYGRELKEPLAELYIFSFLSDRSSEFHEYYLQDLRSNPYYDNLKSRLLSEYPGTSYYNQYLIDLESDQHAVSGWIQRLPWHYLLLALFGVSLFFNVMLYLRIRSLRPAKTSGMTATLTKQEQTILEHILEEKTNKDIAETLFVSVSTVKTHINSIYRKLNVSSREEAKSLFGKH